MSKSFYTTGTGSQQTLTNVQDEKIKIYDDITDAEADISNLAENEIVATKDNSLVDGNDPVDAVIDGNMHPVTSNAVYDAVTDLAGDIADLDSKKLQWIVNIGNLQQQNFDLSSLPNGKYLTWYSSLWDSWNITCLGMICIYSGNYAWLPIYDPVNYTSISGTNLHTNLTGFYSLRMLFLGA